MTPQYSEGVESGHAVVARNIRLLRQQRGLSLAELARQSGLAKQTLSKLEQSNGNPTVDTLFSIATALGVPVTRLVAEREQIVAVQRANDVVWQRHDSHEVRLLDHVYGSGVIENYLMRIHPVPEGQGGEPELHPAGTLEHLYVIVGSVRVGPVDSPIELREGDFARYAGDRPHRYQSLSGESLVHIVVSVPRVQPGTGAMGTQRQHGGGVRSRMGESWAPAEEHGQAEES
ncbi:MULTISPECIES: helix-turn-helix domain-containing protein [unclassified Frankia]|uniref:helix-turn-helix domain-containing protein n=1 Tax=unclassified Frankia TaxID=2632575 RepID=UPI000A623D79|nr:MULTISPECIES: XRE family transcriptional regulator [unclassified Frankia]